MCIRVLKWVNSQFLPSGVYSSLWRMRMRQMRGFIQIISTPGIMPGQDFTFPLPEQRESRGGKVSWLTFSFHLDIDGRSATNFYWVKLNVSLLVNCRRLRIWSWFDFISSDQASYHQMSTNNIVVKTVTEGWSWTKLQMTFFPWFIMTVFSILRCFIICYITISGDSHSLSQYFL